MTVAFAAIAVGMVITRIHRREAAARVERVLAQARALQRATRLLLIVRDRANTPLQTIAFASALLARRRPEQLHVALAMEASVARLRRLSLTLERGPLGTSLRGALGEPAEAQVESVGAVGMVGADGGRAVDAG